MAKIYKQLSKRVQAGTGLAEILLSLKDGHSYFVRAKSGIYVTADNFRNGEIVVNRRKVGNDVVYHEEQQKKLSELESHIYSEVKKASKGEINSDWFKEVVDRFMNPDRYAPKDEETDVKPTFFELAGEYLEKRQFSYDHTKAFRVVVRDVARFEGFVRATENKNFLFDVDTLTRDNVEDFISYLRNEYSLSKEYPKIFARLLKEYPVGVRKGHTALVERGENSIIKLVKKLKAFFRWLYETGRTSNKPFEGIKIGSETYGTPYYITIDERNKIAETECGSDALNIQRDIFIFHCFTGCRVSDLNRLTAKNIVDGILVYMPHKTKDEESATPARVPLHPKAVELVKKYEGRDSQGRLFPFISAQKYNDAIKKIFAAAGITRNVIVRNATSGENEIRPINELASSHLARRTFVGNAYQKVSDPNIICRMSGHVEGSRAFTRYRVIQDSTLKGVIDLIG